MRGRRSLYAILPRITKYRYSIRTIKACSARTYNLMDFRACDHILSTIKNVSKQVIFCITMHEQYQSHEKGRQNNR